MNKTNFGDQLSNTIQKSSPLIIGIDPDLSLLPEKLYETEPQNSILSFCKLVIDQIENQSRIIKFQIAYFEQYGIEGLIALKKALKYAKDKGFISILDCKRGDIGSTAKAYAKSYLTPNQDFEADAITLSPYLGPESLEPFLSLAQEHHKGLFILVRTSNKNADQIQETGTPPIAEKIAQFINKENKIDKGSYGYISAVIGATIKNKEHYRDLMPNSYFLMPGVGAQGASIKDLKILMDKKGLGILIPISRGITKPSNRNISIAKYKQEIQENIKKYYQELK